MKKFFVAIVFVAGMIAGCQKTDIYHGAGVPIEFCGNMVKQTKASGTPSATNDGLTQNLYAQDFRVWAFQNWDDPLTTANEINSEYDGITNLLISRKADKWDTGKEYYWPGKDKQLKFYAISSATWTAEDAEGPETVEITHNPANSQALGTMTISDFTVAPQADNDLMVADACIQMQNGSTTTAGVIVKNEVSQTFRHALTKVRFTFITTTSTIPVFVQKIETNALYNKGDLEVTFETEIGFEWTPETSTTFADDYNVSIDFAAKNVEKVWKDDPAATAATPVAELEDKTGITLNSTEETPLDSWLMIPQELSGKTVTITYIIKDRQFKRTFPLDIENDLESWEPNQFVTYKVSIAPNKIDFSAVVEGWSEKTVEVGDTDVNS